MYTRHDVFEAPNNPNTRIWRYMDFTKYVNLLERRALFFCRADHLGDPYEGSYPEPNLSQRPASYAEVSGRKTTPEAREFFTQSQSSNAKDFLQQTFICSWHMNEYQSAAMWKLYLKSDEGVAIQSTFQCLCDSLKAGRWPIFIGVVE